MGSSLQTAQFDNANCSIKAIVEFMVRALVDRPDAVAVTEIAGTNSIIYELSVAKDDMGKIIGKEGRTAGALRTIVNAVSMKVKKRSVLEILELSPRVPSTAGKQL